MSFDTSRINPIIVVLTIIISILSYFTFIEDLLQSLLSNYGISNPIYTKIFSFLLVVIFVVVAIIIFNIFLNRYIKKRLIILEQKIDTTVWKDGSGERIKSFQKLRSEAKESIMVMGIGMGYFSKDLEVLENILNRGINIDLLMINPSIIGGSSLASTYDGRKFDEYFNRNQYKKDIQQSLKSLRSFIRIYQRKKNILSDQKNSFHINIIQNITSLFNFNGTEKNPGKINLYTYKYFIPINVTIIDPKRKNGKMLYEFCIPFSENRICFKILKKTYPKVFKVLHDQVVSLLDKSG